MTWSWLNLPASLRSSGTSFLRSLRLHDAKNLSEELNAADLGQTVLSDLGTFESWSPGTELGREQGAFACHKNTESMQMQDLVMQAKWDMNNQWVGTTGYANTRKLAELNDHWGAHYFVHESYSAQTTQAPHFTSFSWPLRTVMHSNFRMPAAPMRSKSWYTAFWLWSPNWLFTFGMLTHTQRPNFGMPWSFYSAGRLQLDSHHLKLRTNIDNIW